MMNYNSKRTTEEEVDEKVFMSNNSKSNFEVSNQKNTNGHNLKMVISGRKK